MCRTSFHLPVSHFKLSHYRFCCHSDRPQKAGKMSKQEPHEVQSRGMQRPAPGEEQCQEAIHRWVWGQVTKWKAAWQGTTWGPAGQKAGHEPAVCPCTNHPGPGCCTGKSTASRSREAISPPLRTGHKHLECWASQYQRDGDTLDQVQCNTTKVIKDCSIWPLWKGWQLGLFSLEKVPEQFYQHA